MATQVASWLASQWYDAAAEARHAGALEGCLLRLAVALASHVPALSQAQLQPVPVRCSLRPRAVVAVVVVVVVSPVALYVQRVVVAHALGGGSRHRTSQRKRKHLRQSTHCQLRDEAQLFGRRQA